MRKRRLENRRYIKMRIAVLEQLVDAFDQE